VFDSSFWKLLLQKRLPSNALSSVSFAVFGLGDSSYSCYNFVGKKLYRRLLALGAHALIDRGEGDDQHPLGLEAGLEPWLETLWRTLLRLYPLPEGMEILPADILPPSRYRLLMMANSNGNLYKVIPRGKCNEKCTGQRHYYTRSHPFYATVLENRRLTSAQWEQDVRLITLDLTDSDIRYEPGDVVSIMPRNSPKDAENFAKFMGLDPQQIIAHILPNENHGFESGVLLDLNGPLTVQELFESYLDIMGTPRRYFFEILSFFAVSPLEKERLQYFSSVEGQEDLREYNHREHRTVFQCLQDFPSCKPPLEYLIEMIPPLQPRQFSICSSMKAHSNQLQLTVAVVHFQTRMKRIRKGVCSNWLASLEPNSGDSIHCKVPLWIKRGSMRLPSEPSCPMIMIGPGTGLAVFRAFLEERDSLKKEGVCVGANCFFFGCRHSEKDFLYRDQWLHYVEIGTLSLFEVAFSRDQPEKIYVHHKIAEHSQELWRLINVGAFIYVSGSSLRMPLDVRETFKAILQKEGSMEPLQSEAFLSGMEKSKRYQCETWS